MTDRILYTVAAAIAIVAAIIVAYEWLKERAASVDNVYPLHRRTS